MRGNSIVLANPVTANSPARFNGGNATEEQRLGQRNFQIPNVGRIQTPEDANADMAEGAFVSNPGGWMESALDQCPAVIAVEGDFTVLTADFNVMANFQYVRAAADLIGAEGRNDQNTYQFLNTLGVFTAGSPAAGAFSQPNLILGFQIEWGVELLSFQPFTMEVQTFNFRGRSYQPVNRHFTLRMGGASGAKGGNAGIFQFLFGQRLTSSDGCGYTYGGAFPLGGAGMNKAIVQPAHLGLFNNNNSGFALPPFTYEEYLDAPSIRLTIPASLATAFGATVHMLSVASPFLAATREALFIDE